MTAFPEYDHEESTMQIRAYFLGAARCWGRAHLALLVDDKPTALEEMERCLDLAIAAHKELRSQGVLPQERNPELVERAAPAPALQCKHGTPLDIPCVECLHEAERAIIAGTRCQHGVLMCVPCIECQNEAELKKDCVK